jgi:cell migration-inducing and hyaluronan-binding protein
MFELPGFANADSATKQDSLDALRKASETSYFKDKDSLWVKVVVPNPPAQPINPLERQVSVRVSR